MDKERISQLIARKLSGEASPDEIKELDTHLNEHPEDGYFLSILDDYWATAPVTDEDADSEAHFLHILDAAAAETEEPEAQLRPRYIRRMLLVAAVLSGLILCGWLYTAHFRGDAGTTASSLTEIVAKPGAKSRLLLSDGTVVWLNSGSRISYPASFTDSLREVTLEGEAYFDVATQANRPFIVHTRDIHIRVLGTAFNVKCYPGEHTSEATLIRGLVQVSKTGDNGKEILLLHPHEKIVVNSVPADASGSTEMAARKDMVVQRLKASIADTSILETAWVYNKLVFDGEDFGEIAAEMERWYNVKISINDPAVARYRFHAKFENERITEVLAALQVSLPFTFKITDNEVNIYK